MRQVQKQSWHHRIQDVKCHVKSGKQVSKQSQQTLLTHSSLVSSLLPAQPLAPQNHSLSTPGHSMTAQRNNPCTAWYMTYMLYTPPAFRVYTPPASYISIKCMRGRGAGGQGRRRKEVPRRFIHCDFLVEWDTGGPALHQHKTIFGKPQKCIPLGGELLLWTISSWQVKNLKMYET